MSNNQWHFIDDKGSFRIENPEAINELYFPLCNELGLMSAITPSLHGDLKTGQNEFILLPVSVEDLHNSKAARNFWFYDDKMGPWSVSGNSASAHLSRFGERPNTRVVEAGLLWHKMTYTDPTFGLEATTLNFVPVDETLEVMKVTVKNISQETKTLTPTSAIPLYGRSAENIRDHRHVTSLVNRPVLHEHGITMQPVIHFDERGHRYNHRLYYVLGMDGTGKSPLGTIGALSDFIGNQGDLEWPESIVKNLSPDRYASTVLDGKECIGALRFETITLAPGQSYDYTLLIGIGHDTTDVKKLAAAFATNDLVETALQKVVEFWTNQSQKAVFKSGLNGFDDWMRWVQVQPVFRKIYGCSFLPYHDYGKGGRGWRDLWQDLLSLILLQPQEAKDLLINNFAGIRVDGTNATIIGTGPGEFIADRNNIPRVWMDHGAWPYLTTRLYIDQSGDTSILFKKQLYFRDRLLKRATLKDEQWTEKVGSILKDDQDAIYEGSLIEHLLTQHLAAFYNVGDHNIMLLEGADWNDTLDMARDKGESVAFTALYGSNLLDMADLLEAINQKDGLESLSLQSDLVGLLNLDGGIDYNQVPQKRKALASYLTAVQPNFKGISQEVTIHDLIRALRAMGQWIKGHLNQEEYIALDDTTGFYRGYYNNEGLPVDGRFEDAVRMNLTGQVFPAMFGLAPKDRIKAAYKATRTYLKDETTGGYKLNTPLGPNQLNFGRGFAFAYGEKENGATFSHMVVMYLNALYNQDLVDEGYEVFRSLFDLSLDTVKSKIYPGIPEYFNLAGKGMYHYLTGSASWLFLTIVTKMYGVSGDLGDLVLSPRLTHDQYVNGKATITTTFASTPLQITYLNDSGLSWHEGQITGLTLNGKALAYKSLTPMKVKISRQILMDLSPDQVHDLRVTIGA